jgi:hypothetical protein
VKGRGSQHPMARHAVAVAFTLLIHTLLGLVSAMSGPAATFGVPGRDCNACTAAGVSRRIQIFALTKRLRRQRAFQESMTPTLISVAEVVVARWPTMEAARTIQQRRRRRRRPDGCPRLACRPRRGGAGTYLQIPLHAYRNTYKVQSWIIQLRIMHGQY